MVDVVATLSGRALAEVGPVALTVLMGQAMLGRPDDHAEANDPCRWARRCPGMLLGTARLLPVTGICTRGRRRGCSRVALLTVGRTAGPT